MVQEPELEEGETCCDNDEASIDPDIALSYIVRVSYLLIWKLVLSISDICCLCSF